MCVRLRVGVCVCVRAIESGCVRLRVGVWVWRGCYCACTYAIVPQSWERQSFRNIPETLPPPTASLSLSLSV